MIEKSFNKELNAGDSAKVYVAPQKIMYQPLILLECKKNVLW